jgi:hypothetical protein
MWAEHAVYRHVTLAAEREAKRARRATAGYDAEQGQPGARS